MCKTMLAHLLHALHYLHKHSDRVVLGKFALVLLHEPPQIELAVLQHHVSHILVYLEVEQLHDVLVAHLLEQFDFVLDEFCNAFCLLDGDFFDGHELI